MAKSWIRLNAEDNVAVALESLQAGLVLEVEPGLNTTLSHPIRRGHKFAIRSMKKGDVVFKYGAPIGVLTEDVGSGDHVHTHNLEYANESLASSSLSHAPQAKTQQVTGLADSFMGYPRPDGRVGVRNFVLVAATVNCSASVVRAIAARVSHSRPDIHGIVPVVHDQGCAQSRTGPSHEILNRTLVGWLTHPNVVGAVIVGLGCEGTTPSSLGQAGLKGSLPYVGIQVSGGTSAAIRDGVRQVERLLEDLPTFERQECSVAHLRVATNCGGSDSLSGLSANPLVGVFSDALSEKGGTSVLAEIPECHGAEAWLLSRCSSQGDRRKLQEIFAWWLERADAMGCSLDHNLSPGNLSGGLTTIIEKSLGAVAKSGQTPITSVLDYGEQVRMPGVAVMNTPGFDPCSVTGLVAGGCQMVLFTTGRGSCFGCSIAPTIKVTTSSELYRKMREDMDFDGQAFLNDPDATLRDFWKLCLDTASGEASRSEYLGLGAEEFVPWNMGDTL